MSDMAARKQEPKVMTAIMGANVPYEAQTGRNTESHSYINL